MWSDVACPDKVSWADINAICQDITECLLLNHMRSHDTGRDACSKGEQVCCTAKGFWERLQEQH